MTAIVNLMVENIETLDELADTIMLIEKIGFPGGSAVLTPLGSGGLRLQVTAEQSSLPLTKGGDG